MFFNLQITLDSTLDHYYENCKAVLYILFDSQTNEQQPPTT